MPRASGRTRTLRDHVINETPPNRVYRVYRSTAALHPSYLANICRDREGGSIPTKLVRSLLLSICLYVHNTYMYVYVCQKCAPSYHTTMVIRLIGCVRVSCTSDVHSSRRKLPDILLCSSTTMCNAM